MLGVCYGTYKIPRSSCYKLVNARIHMLGKFSEFGCRAFARNEFISKSGMQNYWSGLIGTREHGRPGTFY